MTSPPTTPTATPAVVGKPSLKDLQVRASGRPTILGSRQLSEALARALPYKITGKVHSLRGSTIVAAGLPAPIGSICKIRRRQGDPLSAETIGFQGSQTLLAPFGTTDGINQGDLIELERTYQSVLVSPQLVGRVLDAQGQPIDDLGPLPPGTRVPCDARAVAAMQRPPIDKILPTQVRAIDSLLTLGEGQRIGVFAGSGVGKSTLLGMLARGTEADVVVIALIGERGREVREFLDRDLGEAGRKRCVTVVATSDQPASQRILAAKSATAIAENYRDAGKKVLLLMDSVTRFAIAQREVGLSAGEAPTTRGYPPSVFAMLPQLVERTGKTNRGSITAIYTVLVEGDDPNEPISDTLRGLLDGHIHLSRDIAARGRYPALDILPSLSRLQSQLVDKQHHAIATLMRASMALYRENEDLINIGAYNAGSNAAIDQAIACRDSIETFLTQGQAEPVAWVTMESQLKSLGQQLAPAPTQNPAQNATAPSTAPPNTANAVGGQPNPGTR
jgi:FliI/YscN family ATPase